MTCRRLAPLAAALAFAMPFAPGAARGGAPADDAALAQVNGETVTLADLDAELGSRPLDPAAAPPAVDILERLVENRLLEQEGYRMGAEEEPAVRNQVLDLRRIRAVVALLDSVSAQSASSAAAALDSAMNKETTFRHVAHILVPDEASARGLLDSLAAGADFAGLARRHSTDGNAPKGGDLGWAPAGAYVPAFEAATGSLAPGEVAGPIETEFGWHLITLLETRTESAGQSPAMRDAMHKRLEREERMAAVRRFVGALKDEYGVTVNDSLLATLDFGSTDPAVLDRYKDSDAVLATLPTGRLTVGALNRQILFKYFHGLSGRDNTDAMRDEVFRQWLDEALLSYEARQRGFDHSPAVEVEARQLERALIREEVLKAVLMGVQEPADADVAAYYAANAQRFADPPRVKLRSVGFGDEAAARRFLAQLESGAQFGWLSARDPSVRDADDPLGADWLEPSALGLDAAQLARGQRVGPLPYGEGDGGWAVGELQLVDRPAPPPLTACRGAVSAALLRERQHEAVNEAISRLKDAATVTYAPGAEARIRARLAALTTPDETRSAAAGAAGGAGGGH